jgi:uncharacterized caspase-like protein
MILSWYTAVVRVIAVSIAILIGSHLAAQERRIALVIGNDAYQGSAKLNKAVNDAKLVAQSLEESGFEVELILDATSRTTLSALAKTAQRLSTEDLFLLYYAGHGVQLQGENFLIPIDAKAGSAQELRETAVNFNQIFEELEAARPAVSVWIFDACRDNPFTSSKTRSLRSSRLDTGEKPPLDFRAESIPVITAGKDLMLRHLLQASTVPRRRTQSLTFFSAGSGGCPSETNPGPVTVFAKALSAQIRQGSEIEEATKIIRQEVERQTNGEQVPQIYSDLTGNVRFKGR